MTDNGAAARTLGVYIVVAGLGILLLGWGLTTCERPPTDSERCAIICGPQGVKSFAYGTWGGSTCECNE